MSSSSKEINGGERVRRDREEGGRSPPFKPSHEILPLEIFPARPVLPAALPVVPPGRDSNGQRSKRRRNKSLGQKPARPVLPVNLDRYYRQEKRRKDMSYCKVGTSSSVVTQYHTRYYRSTQHWPVLPAMPSVLPVNQEKTYFQLKPKLG